MILALAVVLGFVASLARYRKNTFNHIATIPLRWAGLAPLALALQLPLLRAPAGSIQHLRTQQVLFLLSHLLLLLFVWRNRRLWGIQILGIGVLCNLAVIVANSGFMPITPETLVQINPTSTLAQWHLGAHYGYSKDIILSHEATRLWALSDILVLPHPFPRPTAFSLGDLLIATGIVALLQGHVRLPTPVRVLSRAFEARGR
jgi:hypothetical protein